MPPIVTAIRRIAIFADLGDADIEAIGARCRWREFDSGQTILGHKDESTDVFFIVEGKVTATIYSPGGKQVVFRDIGAGEMFGEFSAIDQHPRSATVVAAEECVVAALTADAFWEILNTYPGVAARTLRKLTAQLRALTDRVYEVSALAVRNRIHAELLRMARDNVREDGSAVIAPVPTHTDIANRVSTHREAVSREMSALARAGLIEAGPNRWRIVDVAKLREMVEEVLGA